MSEITEQHEKFFLRLQIEGQEDEMEINFGASCYLIHEETFREIQQNMAIPLMETRAKLMTRSSEKLLVVEKLS